MSVHNQVRLTRLAFVGFGEVSSTFYALGLKKVPDLEVLVYIPIHPKTRGLKHKALSQTKLSSSDDPSILSTADIVLSLVTPSVAFAVASNVASHLKEGGVYVDMNSIAAPTAVQIGEIFNSSGVEYVDAAILGPVPLLGLDVPIVLSGQAANSFHQAATSWGFNTRVLSTQPGDASALKMLWSVISKGSIAIFAEALIAAHRMGLQESLLDLIRGNFGHYGSDAMVLRLLHSTATSGVRRLGEMEEVKLTLGAAGVPSWTAEATSNWIEAIAGTEAASPAHSVEAILDSISENLST